MHKKLPIQSLIFANCRPMFTICQDLYTIGAEVCFTRIGDITWRVSDCEELVGGFTGDDGDEMALRIIEYIINPITITSASFVIG